MPGLYDGLMEGLLGKPDNFGGMLSDPETEAAKRNARMAFAASLLQNSGPSEQKRSFLQNLGSGVMAGRQATAESSDVALRKRFMAAQIQAMLRNKEGTKPSSVQEYEYAKQNGFTGSFQDWVVAGGQSSRPSSVQEWDHYSQLLEQDKKNGTNLGQMYLEMKRNPTFMVKDVNTVPTLINPSIGSGTTTTPLSSQESEAASAAEKKRQESAGGALGAAQGAIAGGIQTKGANAEGVISLLDEADPLIDEATGSGGGAFVDSLAGSVGHATGGAKAIARLKVISASLIQNMPRLEGPQSDADRGLYIEAAGQIGDPTVPSEIKKAALITVRRIQEKYKERAAGAGAPPAVGVPGSKSPKRVRVDAQGNVIGN